MYFLFKNKFMSSHGSVGSNDSQEVGTNDKGVASDGQLRKCPENK